MTPWITPRDGSSEVVGTLWISVRPTAVSHSTRSVKVPPTSTPISFTRASRLPPSPRKSCASRSLVRDPFRQHGRQPGRGLVCRATKTAGGPLGRQEPDQRLGEPDRGSGAIDHPRLDAI